MAVHPDHGLPALVCDLHTHSVAEWFRLIGPVVKDSLHTCPRRSFLILWCYADDTPSHATLVHIETNPRTQYFLDPSGACKEDVKLYFRTHFLPSGWDGDQEGDRVVVDDHRGSGQDLQGCFESSTPSERGIQDGRFPNEHNYILSATV